MFISPTARSPASFILFLSPHLTLLALFLQKIVSGDAYLLYVPLELNPICGCLAIQIGNKCQLAQIHCGSNQVSDLDPPDSHCMREG